MISVIKKWYERSFHDEQAVVLVLILFLGVVALVLLGDILTPVIAALVIAFLLQGVVTHLTRLHVPHLASVAIAFLILILVEVIGAVLLMTLLLDQMNNMVREIPTLISLLQERMLTLPDSYPAIVTYEQVDSWSKELNGAIGEFGQWAVSFSQSKISNIISFLVYLVLVPILVFFFLKDKKQLLSWCGKLLPENSPIIRRVWHEMNDQMANYVRGKAIEMLIVGSVSFVTFKLFDLNYAALLAIAVGVSVVVPYVGAFIVTIPIALVAYLQWGFNSTCMWLIFVYVIIQALDGNVLVPLLFSEAVNLHPVAILLAILFFGSVWGMWGVFFAIPLATLVKAVLNAWPIAKDASAQQAIVEP